MSLSRIFPLNERLCAMKPGIRRKKSVPVKFIDVDSGSHHTGPIVVAMSMDGSNGTLVLDATTATELAVTILEKADLDRLHVCYDVGKLRQRLKNILTKHEEEQ